MKRKMRHRRFEIALLFLAVFGLVLAATPAQGADVARSETISSLNDPRTIGGPDGVIVSIVSSFPFPGIAPSLRDMAWDGSSLWIAENFFSTIYQIDPGTGTVISSISAPASNPWGLAFDGVNLINAQIAETGPPSSDVVYTVTTTGGQLNVWPGPTSPDAAPHGCAFDSSTGSLWLSDSASATVYELNPTTGAVISSFAAPGVDVRGLAFVGQDLWVIDLATLTLIRVTTTGTVVDTFDISSLGNEPEGLTSDGQYMWINERDTETIYQIDVGPIPVELMEFVIE